MIKNVQLDYDFSVVHAADHEINSTSGISTKIFNNYNFPKSYCLANTCIHQLWWDNTQLDFNLLEKQLGISVATVSSILLKPGNIIPAHTDTFHKLKTEFGDKTGKMVRAVVYITDYDFGQYTQYRIDSEDNVFTNWRPGQGHLWDDQVLHVTANAGYKNLITLNISGFL
jgi:hypothetical protein